VCGRGDGRRRIVRRSSECAGRRCMGYTAESVWHLTLCMIRVPLRCGNGCAGCLSAGDTSLGHHVVSRVEVFTVLDVSSGPTQQSENGLPSASL